MVKEVVITTSALNSYGSRVLTSGIDLEQYKRNPVLLWMHRRYGREDVPIGRIDNIRVEGDKVIGTPVFDERDEFAAKIKHKWENGFLKMVSAGLSIIELSDAPEHLLPGQTRMTISRSKLDEVSIVDIGANDEALQLYSPSGTAITLSAGQESTDIPLLLSKTQPDNINNPSTNPMNKELLLALGLSEGATEAQAVEAAKALAAKVSASEVLQLSLVEGEVKEAIRLGKLPADKEQHFLQLGKAMGLESLRITLSSMQPAARPSSLVQPSGAPAGSATYSKLSEVPADAVAQLKAESPEEYARLYKAEFGFAPPL